MARLEINGRVVEIGDEFLSMSPEQQNATVDEIARTLGPAAQPQSEMKPPAGTNMAPTPPVAQPQPAPPERTFAEGLARGSQVSGQGLARALADLYGMGPDMANLIINGLSGTVNVAGNAAEALGAPEIPDIPRVAIPGGSDQIADIVSRHAAEVGIPTLAPEEMTGTERLFSNINRFGGQALASGTGIAKAGGKMVAEETGALADDIPTIVRGFVEPYTKGNAGTVIAGDTIGGAGAGAGLHALDENAPDSWKQNPIIRMLVALGGGVSGTTAANVVTSPKRVAQSIAENILPEPGIARDPESGTLPTMRDAQEAARFQQRQASNPQLAAQNIAENQQAVQQMGGPTPTSAMMSDDVGLRRQERGFRAIEGKPFEDLDVRNRNAASTDLQMLRPEGADPMLPGVMAEEEIARLLEQADAVVNAAQTNSDQAVRAEQELADIYSQFAGMQGPASEALDKAIVGDTLKPMQAEKNRLYGAIDPDASTYVPALEIQRAIDEMQSAAAPLGPNMQSQILPEGLISDLQAMMTTADTDIPTMPFRSMNLTRPAMSEQISGARKAGQYQKADNIKALKGTINTATEDLAKTGGAAGERAKAAEDYYTTEFAPKFNQGEGGRFRRDINADDKYRSNTPPTKTASRFLTAGAGGKEKAADLQRILKDSPSEAAGKKAARDYVMADLSKVVVNGKVSETRLQQWMNQNEGMLSQLPEVGKEVNALLNDVRSRSTRANIMKAELEKAGKAKKQTEKDVNDSAFSLLAGANPDVAVKDILNSRNPAAAVDEIMALVKNDPAAKKGFEAAVADHLIDKVTTTDVTGISGDSLTVSLAKTAKTFKQHEAVLEKVFGDKVQHLRQVQKRLELLSKRGGSATTGSPTIENANLVSKAMGTAEILIRLKFGALRGGSEMRKIKLLTDKLPNIHNGANRLIWRAQFDPEVAKYLLTKPLTPENLPEWSAWLRRTLAAAEGGRAVGEEEKDTKLPQK